MNLTYRAAATISGVIAVMATTTQVLATPKQVELAPTQATTVSQASPSAIRPTSDPLITRLNKEGDFTRMLLAFDLAEVRSAHIDSATLKLKLISGTGLPITKMAASGIASPWDGSVTWDTQPQRTESFAVVDVPRAPAEVTLDVTSLLQGTIERNDSLEGIALSGPISGDSYERRFSAVLTDTKLTVAFTPGAAVRAPKPSPSVTTTAADFPNNALSTRTRLIIGVVSGLLIGASVAWFRRRRSQASM